MKINHKTELTIPVRKLVGLIIAVAVFVWAYFAVEERLNMLEHVTKIIDIEMKMNSEFRVKWPRGELGSLPADSEQFLLIESLLTDVEDIQTEIKESRHNAVNILRLQKDVEKILEAIEIIKDKVRNNGNHS